MVLFPRKGDRLRAHSVLFQATRVAESGKGVVSDMTPSRSSATAVAIAAGTWTDGSVLNTYAGGSITGIPAANSGKHRYDLIILDTSTGAVSRIGGSEDTPTVISDFLENLQPLPPELTSENQVLIAIIIVTSSGISSGNFGHYATGGVANLIAPVRGQIDHLNLANKGVNGHVTIDAHLGSASNPHSTTAAQVGADVTTGTIHAATSKGTPIDGDELEILDSAASYGLKKLTWANLKATLKTYFDGLYALTGHNHSGTYEPANANIQSHVGSSNNPHGTTYAQVGAEPANANIQQHIASASNPHSTTYGQVGAAPAAKGVTNGDGHDHDGGDGAQIAYSSLSGRPVRRIAINFPVGDGKTVLPTETDAHIAEVEIPIACTIIAARIHERTGISGNISLTLYKRTYSGDWAEIDSYAISDGARYEETGLSISLAAGDWVALVVNSVTSMKQITCSLTCEVA